MADGVFGGQTVPEKAFPKPVYCIVETSDGLWRIEVYKQGEMAVAHEGFPSAQTAAVSCAAMLVMGLAFAPGAPIAGRKHDAKWGVAFRKFEHCFNKALDG